MRPPPARLGAEPGSVLAARGRQHARQIERLRRRQQQRRVILALLLLGAVALLGVGVLRSPGHHGSGGVARASVSARASASASPSATPTPTNVPTTGRSTFVYADASATIAGSSGTIQHYRVAVENGSKVGVAAFATQIAAILADPRGWTAGDDVRFQRVAQTGSADFTVYLATASTSEKICDVGGVHTKAFMSCRLPGQVVINLSRWLIGVPGYGAPLADYQAYALNHEVGRELGHALEACPGPGKAAPVMQQQSLGLAGCRPNAWPYLSGVAYDGPVLP
jgi:hypothetical protein